MRRLLLALLATGPAVAHADRPRVHDGFHLSLGAGLGYGLNAGRSKDADGEDVISQVGGLGVAGMVLAGWTVAEGLVIGGGSMGGHVFSPSGTVDRQVVTQDEETGEDTKTTETTDIDADSDVVFNLLGPYLDYYSDETDGLHILVMLGLATLEDGVDQTDGISLGFGAAVGCGFDWWVSEQWSLGVLARLSFLVTSNELKGDGGKTDVDYRTGAPAVLFTGTWH